MATVELLGITPDAEHLIEKSGRTCYKSHEKLTNDSCKRFIRMLVKNKHYSVLEHAYATFRIIGGSRSFTHQLVRHRLCSFSQQSQRYVHEKSFSVVTPPRIYGDNAAHKIFDEVIEHCKDAYMKLIDLEVKKEDARFVLPNAVISEIIISANFRQLRHIFDERCSKKAQWEIREITLQMLDIMKKRAPTVFEDYSHPHHP